MTATQGQRPRHFFSQPSTARAVLGFALVLPFLAPTGCESPEPQPVIRNEPGTPQAASTKPATPPEAPLLLSADELKQVRLELSIEPDKMGGTLNYLVYNGSQRDLKAVTIEIAAKNKEGEPVLTQKYGLDMGRSSYLSPFSSSGPCGARLGFTLKDGQTWTWRLVAASALR